MKQFRNFSSTIGGKIGKLLFKIIPHLLIPVSLETVKGKKLNIRYNYL